MAATRWLAEATTAVRAKSRQAATRASVSGLGTTNTTDWGSHFRSGSVDERCDQPRRSSPTDAKYVMA
jgi:hypothetical protein